MTHEILWLEDVAELHWRDRLALRMVLWVAVVLFNKDFLSKEEQKEIGHIRTALNVYGRSTEV